MFTQRTPDWIHVGAGLGPMVLSDLGKDLLVAKPWRIYHKMKDFSVMQWIHDAKCV